MTAALGFLRRDWLRRASYRFQVVWQGIGLAVLLFLLYLGAPFLISVARTHGAGDAYVAFLLSGVAFTDLFLTSMQAFPATVREAQLQGTLEPTLVAPLPVHVLVVASSAFPLLQSLARTLAVVGAAVFVFSYWHDADVPGALVVLVLGSLTFATIGLLAGAFVISFKAGDPVIGVFALVSAGLGGTLFPVSLLPAWLQSIAWLMPLTNALTGMRLALAGSGPGPLLPHLVVLCLTAAVMLPVAMIAFRASLRHAKQEGSLVQY